MATSSSDMSAMMDAARIEDERLAGCGAGYTTEPLLVMARDRDATQ